MDRKSQNSQTEIPYPALYTLDSSPLVFTGREGKLSELQTEIEKHFKKALPDLIDVLYYDRELTYEQIGDYLGASASFIGTHMRKNGLSYRQLAREYHKERRQGLSIVS
jgi:hypothetical protein